MAEVMREGLVRLSRVGGSSAGDEGGRWQRPDGFGTSRQTGTAVSHEYAPLHCSGRRTLIKYMILLTGHVPVTQGLAMGLAPAPSLLHALVRECRDMSPTLESRVSGPLGRHGVLVWAGYGRSIMLRLVFDSTYVIQLHPARNSYVIQRRV